MSDWLGSIESLLDAVLSMGEYISQGVYSLVMAALYPFQVISYWSGHILGVITNAFIDLYISLNDIYLVLVNHIASTILSSLPNLWTVIILLGLGIVFALRLYYFIKDISIFGCKI